MGTANVFSEEAVQECQVIIISKCSKHSCISPSCITITASKWQLKFVYPGVIHESLQYTCNLLPKIITDQEPSYPIAEKAYDRKDLIGESCLLKRLQYRYAWEIAKEIYNDSTTGPKRSWQIFRKLYASGITAQHLRIDPPFARFRLNPSSTDMLQITVDAFLLDKFFINEADNKVDIEGDLLLVIRVFQK